MLTRSAVCLPLSHRPRRDAAEGYQRLVCARTHPSQSAPRAAIRLLAGRRSREKQQAPRNRSRLRRQYVPRGCPAGWPSTHQGTDKGWSLAHYRPTASRRSPSQHARRVPVLAGRMGSHLLAPPAHRAAGGSCGSVRSASGLVDETANRAIGSSLGVPTSCVPHAQLPGCTGRSFLAGRPPPSTIDDRYRRRLRECWMRGRYRPESPFPWFGLVGTRASRAPRDPAAGQ